MTAINASPTKTFFVDMLVRDIELEDAILDLLDNCVDGIQRSIKDKLSDPELPYRGFWAKISFSGNEFTIKDNCGGIPLNAAQNYAFRMGRPIEVSDPNLSIHSIGTYGIGMKRAIFKMGKSSEITSRTANESFRVTISNEWIDDSENWELPLEQIESSDAENGTMIRVTNLRDSISEEFGSPNSTFANTLVARIAHSYNYIIKKGFTVFVNDKKVESTPFELLWEGVDKITSSEVVIAPYLYKSTYQDVSIELAVGFYRRDLATEEDGNRKVSDRSGWSIVCNDRVVVYCDKTRLTGWGEAKVPSYHPQFISIAGVVHFRSADPRKLPITTTKRGLDLSSDIYLYTKNFMRESVKLFTNYTNKWKKDIPREKEIMRATRFVDPNEIFNLIPENKWKNKSRANGAYYQPSLPLPESEEKKGGGKSIRFSRSPDEIKIVAEYLFEDEERDANDVGDGCFDKVLKEAQS